VVDHLVLALVVDAIQALSEKASYVSMLAGCVSEAAPGGAQAATDGQLGAA